MSIVGVNILLMNGWFRYSIMIKMSSLFANFFVVFLLIGCSKQQLMTPSKNTHKLDKTNLINNEEIDKANHLPESNTALSSEPIETKPTTLSQLPPPLLKTESNNEVQPTEVKSFEKEQYLTDSPDDAPTLSNQLSEHENEYKPKRPHQTASENKHRETYPSQADETQLENTPDQMIQIQPSDKAEQQNKKAQMDNLSLTITHPDNKNVNSEKRKGDELKTQTRDLDNSSHQSQFQEKYSSGDIQQNQTTTFSNDQYHNTPLNNVIEQTHSLTGTKKRQWNMQRIIKPQ